MLHRRCVLPPDRRLARRRQHENRHGPRRVGDGPPVAWRPSARRSRGHSGAGSQFTSVRFTDRLDEIGPRPSIGTVADSYDNPLAETTNGLYQTECVYGPDAPRPCDDVDQLELATLSWVHWFNEHRLHSHCDDVPPAEFEAGATMPSRTDRTVRLTSSRSTPVKPTTRRSQPAQTIGNQTTEPPTDQGRFTVCFVPFGPGISVDPRSGFVGA